MVDAQRIKTDWAFVASHGDAVPSFFHAALFLARPELRELFPLDLADRRRRWLRTVDAVVGSAGDLEPVVPSLVRLARELRVLGVRREHYPVIGAALLATLRRFSGSRWEPGLAADWRDVWESVSTVMVQAVAAEPDPAWWEAEVTAHERRGPEIAVLRVRPRGPLPYRAGQSIGVSSPLRPAVWRHYSPANVSGPDGTIELQVRLAETGDLSTALVALTGVGDTLRLSSAVGEGLLLDEAGDRRLLLLAGGTGLAPLRALVEQVAATRPRPVTLYWGARTAADLYDLPLLRQWQSRYDWFELAVCVGEPAPGVLTGNPVDLSIRHGHWVGAEVYVCGPREMVSAARRALVGAGVEAGSIHYESYGSDR